MMTMTGLFKTNYTRLGRLDRECAGIRQTCQLIYCCTKSKSAKNSSMPTLSSMEYRRTCFQKHILLLNIICFLYISLLSHTQHFF